MIGLTINYLQAWKCQGCACQIGTTSIIVWTGSCTFLSKTLGIQFEFPWILLPIPSLRHPSESKPGLDDSGCCKFNIYQSSSSFAKAVNFTFIWNDFFNFRDCICNCWRFQVCKRGYTTAWMVDDKTPKSLVISKIDVQFLLYIFVHSSWTFYTLCKGSERVRFTEFTIKLRNSISWHCWSTNCFKFR